MPAWIMATWFSSALMSVRIVHNAQPSWTLVHTAAASWYVGLVEALDPNVERMSAIGRTCLFLLIALLLSASARSASPLRNDRWPAFSPDGKLIAFERSQDGAMDVFVSDIHGGEQRRLTHGPNSILSLAPAWLPSGQALIYTTSNRQGDYGSGSFYEIATSGGESQTIAPAGERGRSISPDGHSLLFLSKQWEVLKLDLQTGAVTTLTHPSTGTLDTEAMWSPDGTKIAFGCGYNDATKLGPICVMNADGSGRHIVSNWPGADEWPTWSPDGKQIAFQSDTDDFAHGQSLFAKQMVLRRTPLPRRPATISTKRQTGREMADGLRFRSKPRPVIGSR
jgi:Tol biopolymer transport system component